MCCLPHGVVFFTAPGVEGAGGFPRKSELTGVMGNGLSSSFNGLYLGWTSFL